MAVAIVAACGGSGTPGAQSSGASSSTRSGNSGAGASSSGGTTSSSGSAGASGSGGSNSAGSSGQGPGDDAGNPVGGDDSGTGGTPSDDSGPGVPTSDAGSQTGGNPPTADPNRVRAVMPLDASWLFFKGDATGADQAAFADTAWRALSVPHDWSIEGPFDQNAPSTGRGGYLPSGVGWYRKHFTLPQTLSARRIFVEFDGVMANSDVYVNGFHLGQRPYGYVQFRYELTGHVTFGTTDNVISVRCDTSVQPASRWYTGAGIYRHVRLIATDPVHVDQWATYVTTPTASTSSATVHVQTSVVNQGTAAQSVSVQAVVSDPGGTALSPVTSTPQSIAAGATANFVLDVPVASPKLWDVTSPNMYRLLTNVQVGGTTLDDDVTPFGIRTLTFDGTTGMSLNGKNLKFKGVAIHHEVSGLGAAVPMRAWQRRLAQLKSLGVNAIRTSHNPIGPDVLDLADRMGLLVLDEFFDVWTAHKYSDVGDYAAFFSKPAPAVTGSPSAGAGATWWQTDVTDIVMSHRNHPSVALYSIGNEIHESISARTPIATAIVALVHKLDPGRSTTQALLDPTVAGDVTGATRTIVDVFGVNYQVSAVTQAIAMAPTRAGVITEIGHQTTTWSTVTSTPALTGEFLWTGVDYLGEAPLGWPNVGSGAGIMDRMGTPKGDGYTYARLWGGTATSPPPTGSTAAKVALSADHPMITTDLNDVAYIRATVADSAGHVVTSASNPVTFSITGPGTIVAVDSATLVGESFRGMQRNAYQGLCFAIVRATGPGTITVSASAAGLTGSSATVQATDGPFVPCSGSCD